MSDTPTPNPKSLENLKPFQPGQSGNPGGRPKGYATKIKELCGDDYGKLAEGFYTIAFGTDEQFAAMFGPDAKRATKDRLVAMLALRDSGPGKPVQALEHRGDAPMATRVVHTFTEDDDQDAGAARETA